MTIWWFVGCRVWGFSGVYEAVTFVKVGECTWGDGNNLCINGYLLENSIWELHF